MEKLLHVCETLDAMSHSEAEVTEPFVVESDGPVLAEEFDGAGNYVRLEPRKELVEVIFVEAYKRPERLQNDLFVAHISDGVD